MNLSGHEGHVTKFCLMFAFACCLVVGLGLDLSLSHYHSVPALVSEMVLV